MRKWMTAGLCLVLAGCINDAKYAAEQHQRMQAATDRFNQQQRQIAGTPEQQLRRCLDVEIRALVNTGLTFVLDKVTNLVMSDCQPHIDTLTSSMNLSDAGLFARKTRAEVRSELQTVLP
jgi:hypothetical protein